MSPVAAPGLRAKQLRLFREGFGGPGELALGGPDPERHVGALRFVDLLAGVSLWTFALEAVWIGDAACFLEASRARVDSFFSFLTGPPGVVAALVTAWGAGDEGGTYTLPCDANGPSLSFRIDGRDYTLTALDLVWKLNATHCALGVEPWGQGQPQDVWRLGQSFLRRFYVLHDAGRKRLGLAPARHPTEARV